MGGGAVAPPPSSAKEVSFTRLVNAHGKKKVSDPPPKFVKKIDSIPEITLPSEKPIQLDVSLADRALIGKFTGLWLTPRSTDAWVQNN